MPQVTAFFNWSPAFEAQTTKSIEKPINFKQRVADGRKHPRKQWRACSRTSGLETSLENGLIDLGGLQAAIKLLNC